MAYVFKQDQSIGHNINRILSEEVKGARAVLESPGEALGETIHTVRKRIKKIRALFRLVRSALKEKDFRRQNNHYRTVGHQLGHLRDATVMINTLDKLRQAQPAAIAPEVYAPLHQALVEQQEQAAHEFVDQGNQVSTVARAFGQAPRKVRGLTGRHSQFGIIAPNLKAIYRRARRAWKVVRQTPTIDHFHELRKEVKTLWYHTRLLQPIWPGLLKAYEQEFGRLGELLGDDHDYGVLALAIESDQFALPAPQTKETIGQGLQAQRTLLQGEIYPLASRLLAEKPGMFIKRLRLYWNIWRAEAKQAAADNRLKSV